MREETKVDLGSVQIHKKVIADIAAAATSEIANVKLVEPDFKYSVLELFGMASHPAIDVTIDKSDHQVSLEIKIVVKYGSHIPDVARQIQDVVRDAVERSADITLKDINVSIQGLERGNQ
ncbi:MAG: hypothetical protein A2Z88_05830 [Omnitrophica WOR_2 bacterium GWA2_47_8]|nr:MAG: hypothetical protein A2Z88_05830 [Omnitrophica WOR_2 bacterium GWA2_47_8]